MCISLQGFLAICLGSSAKENPNVGFYDHSTIFRSTEGPRILGNRNMNEQTSDALLPRAFCVEILDTVRYRSWFDVRHEGRDIGYENVYASYYYYYYSFLTCCVSLRL